MTGKPMTRGGRVVLTRGAGLWLLTVARLLPVTRLGLLSWLLPIPGLLLLGLLTVTRLGLLGWLLRLLPISRLLRLLLLGLLPVSGGRWVCGRSHV